MLSLWRWSRRAAYAAILVLLTLIVGGGCDARRRLPDLKPWHRVRLDDMTASTLDDRFTFAQYQAWEARLFAQVRALEATNDPADRTPVNRYHPGSLSHPSSAGRDWNGSFETIPATIRGGALLVHGLTDSPYSMRKVAEVLRDHPGPSDTAAARQSVLAVIEAYRKSFDQESVLWESARVCVVA